MLTLTPVQSSLLVAVGWDPATDEMVIEFPRGARYAYKGESARQHHDALLNPDTESVGKYFLDNVKKNDKLAYRRIDDAASPTAAAPKSAPAVKPGELKLPDPLKQLF